MAGKLSSSRLPAVELKRNPRPPWYALMSLWQLHEGNDHLGGACVRGVSLVVSLMVSVAIAVRR
jgi:hypothetical protein